MKKSNRFGTRIMFANMLITATVIIALLSFFVVQYRTDLQQTQVQQLETLNRITATQLENSIDLLDTLALQLVNNSAMYDIMLPLHESDDMDNHFADHLVESTTLQRLILSNLVKPGMVSRVCIYNGQGDYYVVGQSVDDNMAQDYWDKKYIARVESKLKEEQAYAVFGYEWIDRLSEYGSRHGYINITRAITYKNLFNHESIAYVEVQLSLAEIQNQLTNLATQEDAFLFRHAPSEIPMVYSEPFGDEIVAATFFGIDVIANQPPVRIDSGYYACLPVGETPFELVSYRSAQSMEQEILRMINVVLVVVVLLIGLTALIQRYVVKRLTRPLIALFEQVKRNQSWSTEELEEPTDEMETISQSFHEMMDVMKVHSEELILAQTGEVRAQALAIQAQVNPHFIHNTLSVLIALSQEGQSGKVEEVAERLSEMIRYNTNFQTPDCSLQEELNQLENYMQLIKVRYEEYFDYEIIMPDTERQIHIPRFVTQPIVENALKHSLKLKEFPWQMQVECHVCSQNWVIKISDNGVGITPEKAKELNDRVLTFQQENMEEFIQQLKIGGYSLLNIAARLSLAYKEKTIFHICPNELGGTTVTIGGPIDD